MKFDYKHLGTNADDEVVIRPIIPITLKHEDVSLKYEVLVDSGADENIFDADLAKPLGLKLTDGKKGYFQGVTGSRQARHTHQLQIEVGGHIYDTKAMFADLPLSAHGIVGQRGFFEFFTVKFKHRSGRVELRKNPDT